MCAGRSENMYGSAKKVRGRGWSGKVLRVDENGLGCECKLNGEEWLPSRLCFVLKIQPATRKHLALGLLLTLCWDRVYHCHGLCGQSRGGEDCG